jgi:hypothetical protein
MTARTASGREAAGGSLVGFFLGARKRAGVTFRALASTDRGQSCRSCLRGWRTLRVRRAGCLFCQECC